MLCLRRGGFIDEDQDCGGRFESSAVMCRGDLLGIWIWFLWMAKSGLADIGRNEKQSTLQLQSRHQINSLYLLLCIEE